MKVLGLQAPRLWKLLCQSWLLLLLLRVRPIQKLRKQLGLPASKLWKLLCPASRE